MIYIIGDSHVSVFSGTDKTHDGLRHIQPEFGTCYTLRLGNLRPIVNRFEQRIPYFCPIKIGSNTAYNSYDKLPRIDQVISEYNITDKDYVFTCFGEIDIRNHIGFHADLNGYSFEEGIRICVDRYMETILYLKNKGLKVGVYGSPPSSVGLGKPIDYGDVIFRNKMTIVFNEYLGEKCVENNIPFKDVSKYLMLEDGTTDQRFIMDDIHLSQESMPFIINLFSDIIDEQTRD
jgi:hypothetical protein